MKAFLICFFEANKENNGKIVEEVCVHTFLCRGFGDEDFLFRDEF